MSWAGSMPRGSLSPTRKKTGSSRRALTGLLCALGVTVATVACTQPAQQPDEVAERPSAPASPGPPARGRVALGVLGESATLDPYSSLASSLTYSLVRPLYPSLFRLRPDGAPVPYLAERIEPASGGVRVFLRRARWSDGRRIVARDVVASARRAGPPSGFAEVRARVEEPRVVRFRGDVNDWETTLASIAYVLPEGQPAEVSGGPLLLERHRKGLEIVYGRNPNWFGGSVGLRRVVVRFVNDVRIMLSLLERGELDAGALPSTVNLTERVTARGLEGSAALGWESIQLRAGQAPPSVMAAVGSALKRRLLQQTFIRDDGRISSTLAPRPGAGGADGPWRAPTSSTSFGRPVSLAVPEGDELLSLLQRALQVQLDDLGQLDLVATDLETFYGTWMSDAPVDLVLARAVGGPGLGRPSDPAAIPLFQVATHLVWRPGIEGLQPNPTFEGPLWNVESWTTRRRRS